MQWRVYNKHPEGLTHREKFKGDDIIIKAGEFVLMDYEEAVQFKGQFFPIRDRGDGTQDPASYKCIELKKHDEAAVEAKPFYISPVDGKKFDSQSELDAYIKESFSHLEPVKDETLDREIAAKKGKK